MTERYFIENQDIVHNMMIDLEPTGKYTIFHGELYVNPETGEQWEKYEFEVEYDNELEEEIGLRKYPHPNTDKIIEIALNSPHYDEIESACTLLLVRESYQKIEFRKELLDAIESNINEIDSNRYNTIYEFAELYDETNKRKILGKHHAEIVTDAAYFSELANLAKSLKDKIL